MFEAIKRFFRKGAVKMNLKNSINKITDHEKINVSWNEFQRIEKDLLFYKGEFPNVKYTNTYGRIKERPYVSLNVSKLSAHRMATLIFNEKCRINIADNNAASYINDVLQNNKFMRNFSEYLETMVALGGVAIRPYYSAAENKIKLSWIQATNFFPLQSNTADVSECAIAIPSQVTRSGKTYYYTLLEFHEWKNGQYVITNELYESDSAEIIGHNVPLGILYEDMQPQTVVEGLTAPLFIYLKNTGKNNLDITSPLGLGHASNSLNTLKQINDTYDMLNHEIKMSKRRIAVSDALLNVMPDESGESPVRTFDTNESIYETFPTYGDEDYIKDLTAPLRAAEYTEALNTLIKVYEQEIGVSQGTFSFDVTGGIKTATEVASENSMTYQTRNEYTTAVEHALKELIIAILELSVRVTGTNGAALYNGPIPTHEEITVDFDDGVFTDRAAELEFLTKAKAAGFIPTENAIMRLFDLDKETAAQWISIINNETMATVTASYGDMATEPQLEDE